LLVFIREILTCDLVLPHFIAALEQADASLSFTTIMDYFTTLVLATTGISQPSQFNAIVHVLAAQVEKFSKVGKLG